MWSEFRRPSNAQRQTKHLFKEKRKDLERVKESFLSTQLLFFTLQELESFVNLKAFFCIEISSFLFWHEVKISVNKAIANSPNNVSSVTLQGVKKRLLPLKHAFYMLGVHSFLPSLNSELLDNFEFEVTMFYRFFFTLPLNFETIIIYYHQNNRAVSS